MRDVLIMAAAVADWRPRDVAAQQAQEGGGDPHARVGPDRGHPSRAAATTMWRSDVFVVGFAAETEHVIDNARAKLDAKDLDLIVVNDVSREGIGMGADDNEVTVIARDGTAETIARAPKSDRCRCDRAHHRGQSAMTFASVVPGDALATASRRVHLLHSRRSRRARRSRGSGRDPLRQAIDSRLRRGAIRGDRVRGSPRHRRRHRRAAADPRSPPRAGAPDRGSILRSARRGAAGDAAEGGSHPSVAQDRAALDRRVPSRRPMSPGRRTTADAQRRATRRGRPAARGHRRRARIGASSSTA